MNGEFLHQILNLWYSELLNILIANGVQDEKKYKEAGETLPVFLIF